LRAHCAAASSNNEENSEKMTDSKGNGSKLDELAVEVFLPDVVAKRTVREGKIAGLTHRKLLPTLPRSKMPGCKFLESSLVLHTPSTRRPTLDFQLPHIQKKPNRRSVSCDPAMSSITSYLNKRVGNVSNKVMRNQSVDDKDGPPDPVEAVVANDKKKQSATTQVLGEVRDILAHCGHYFEGVEVKRAVHNDMVKVQRGEKKEEKKKAEAGGFKQKGPKALFEYIMGRVHVYRKSSEKFEQLSATVKSWLAEPQSHSIEHNMKVAWTLSFEERKRLWAKYREKNQELAAAATMRVTQRDAERESYRTRKLAKIRRDHQHADRVIANRFRAAAKDKADRIARVAVLCTAVGSRAGLMFNQMLAARPVRERLKKHTKAALTLQKWMRPIIWRKKGKVIRRGMRKLKALIGAYQVRWLLKKMKKSSFVILQFTKEMSSQSEMKTAIGNYMRHVKRLQRVWRRYGVWKSYVLEVRREQFDTIEETCVEEWERRKEKIEKALSAAENPDPDAIIGDFNMRRPPHRISEAIREQLLFETFRQDQSTMRSKLALFSTMVEEFGFKMTTWKALIEAQQIVGGGKSMKQMVKDEPPPERPQRPIIVPRLSEDEIWILIKKGHQRMDELEAAGQL